MEATEQSFQEIENSRPISLQEGNTCNLREGGGETGETQELRSPQVVIQQGTPSIPDRGSVVKLIPTPSNHPRNNSQEIPEGYWHIFDQMANNPQTPQTSTLQYPIVDMVVNAPMKSIPLQNIPTFHGLTSEDRDAFLFKFYVLFWGYDYTTDPQNLKLFPSTLKGEALHWFMGLGGGTINDWEQMKTTFLKKYQEYCRSRELKAEIFQMMARPSKTLEEYVE